MFTSAFLSILFLYQATVHKILAEMPPELQRAYRVFYPEEPTVQQWRINGGEPQKFIRAVDGDTMIWDANLPDADGAEPTNTGYLQDFQTQRVTDGEVAGPSFVEKNADARDSRSYPDRMPFLVGPLAEFGGLTFKKTGKVWTGYKSGTDTPFVVFHLNGAGQIENVSMETTGIEWKFDYTVDSEGHGVPLRVQREVANQPDESFELEYEIFEVGKTVAPPELNLGHLGAVAGTRLIRRDTSLPKHMQWTGDSLVTFKEFAEKVEAGELTYSSEYYAALDRQLARNPNKHSISLRLAPSRPDSWAIWLARFAADTKMSPEQLKTATRAMIRHQEQAEELVARNKESPEKAARLAKDCFEEFYRKVRCLVKDPKLRPVIEKYDRELFGKKEE